jgi:hypothetical protein
MGEMRKYTHMKAIAYTKYGPQMFFSSKRLINLFLKTMKY